MGFIERLRQEKQIKNAKRHEAAESERLEREHKKRDDEQRRQQELVEIQYRKARREQSERFRDESGIMSLLNEIQQLTEDFQVLKFDPMPPVPLRDKDSILIITSLGRYCTSTFWKNHDRYFRRSMRVFSVEICPDGSIHVDGSSSGSSTIPHNMWKENKAVLEPALERAYRHPKTYVWDKYISPSGSSQEFR